MVKKREYRHRGREEVRGGLKIFEESGRPPSENQSVFIIVVGFHPERYSPIEERRGNLSSHERVEETDRGASRGTRHL